MDLFSEIMWNLFFGPLTPGVGVSYPWTVYGVSARAIVVIVMVELFKRRRTPRVRALTDSATPSPRTSRTQTHAIVTGSGVS